MNVMDVVEHHEGWVVRVTDGPTPDHIVLHLAFRNVAGKQHFSYAMRTAWPGVTVTNTPGTVNLTITVELGVSDSGSFSGDLDPILTEGAGWMVDCGFMVHTVGIYPSEIVNALAKHYDGGVFAFVMDVKPLWS